MQTHSTNATRIEIRLFAAAADLVGAKSISIELNEGDTLAELSRRVATDYSELKSILTASRWAVNKAFATQLQPISACDEIAIIPPVSGG